MSNTQEATVQEFAESARLKRRALVGAVLLVGSTLTLWVIGLVSSRRGDSDGIISALFDQAALLLLLGLVGLAGLLLLALAAFGHGRAEARSRRARGKSSLE